MSQYKSPQATKYKNISFPILMITEKSDSQSNTGTGTGTRYIYLEYFLKIPQTKKRNFMGGYTLSDLSPFSNTFTKRLRTVIFVICCFLYLFNALVFSQSLDGTYNEIWWRISDTKYQNWIATAAAAAVSNKFFNSLLHEPELELLQLHTALLVKAPFRVLTSTKSGPK